MPVALFFYAHQTWSTGFFTARFGSLAAFLLYASIILGVAGPVARSVTGSRNSARPPEIFASIFSTISSIFLLASFPFNFMHFGDVMPDFLRFLVSWITNDIAWILLAIGTVGGIFFVGVTTVLYISRSEHCCNQGRCVMSDDACNQPGKEKLSPKMPGSRRNCRASSIPSRYRSWSEVDVAYFSLAYINRY